MALLKRALRPLGASFVVLVRCGRCSPPSGRACRKGLPDGRVARCCGPAKLLKQRVSALKLDQEMENASTCSTDVRKKRRHLETNDERRPIEEAGAARSPGKSPSDRLSRHEANQERDDDHPHDRSADHIIKVVEPKVNSRNSTEEAAGQCKQTQ